MEEKRILPEQLDEFLSSGWSKGRKEIFSEETKRKMSKTRTGGHHTPETKEKIMQSRLGKKSHISGKTPINDGSVSKYIFSFRIG